MFRKRPIVVAFLPALLLVFALCGPGAASDTLRIPAPGEPTPAWVLDRSLEMSIPYETALNVFLKYHDKETFTWHKKNFPSLSEWRSSLRKSASDFPDSKASEVKLSFVQGSEKDGELAQMIYMYLYSVPCPAGLLDWYFRDILPTYIIARSAGSKEKEDIKTFFNNYYEDTLRQKDFGRSLVILNVIHEIDFGDKDKGPLLSSAFWILDDDNDVIARSRKETADAFYDLFFEKLEQNPFPPYALSEGMLSFGIGKKESDFGLSQTTVGQITVNWVSPFLPTETQTFRGPSLVIDPRYWNPDSFDLQLSLPHQLVNSNVVGHSDEYLLLHGSRHMDGTSHPDFRQDEYLTILRGGHLGSFVFSLGLPGPIALKDGPGGGGMPEITLPPHILSDIHEHLAMALNLAAAEMFNVEPVSLSLPERQIPDPPGEVWFSTTNILASGQTVDELRARLQDLQARYDLISSQIRQESLDLARANIENLRDQLGRVGETIFEMRKEGKEISVRLNGLPTDQAMAIAAELEEDRTKNRAMLQLLNREIHRINLIHLEQEQLFITRVWRGMYQSFLDWHSLPAWYDIPSTFIGWEKDSKERAEAILEPQEAVLRLRTMLEEYTGLREKAKAEEARLTVRLEELEPIRQMHAELRSIMASQGWAVFVP